MDGRLLLAGFVGFASGILCRSLFVFPAAAIVFPLLLAGVVLLVWQSARRIAYLVCALALIGTVFGMGRVMLVPDRLPESFATLLETKVALEGYVISEPDIRETTQRVTIRVREGDREAKVLAVAPLYPEIEYGDHVRVQGKMVLPEPFETETGRTFRYDRFLAKDGIGALVEFAEIETLEEGSGARVFVMRALLAAKHLFQEGLASALPEPSASLASGLITGGKQGLGQDLLDAFIIAGLVHIVVLSGYNVMIVAEAVLRAFGRFGKRNAAILAGSTIALFVIAAGAGAASIRAGLMAGLGLLARATGRTYAVVRALLVVAFLMLLWNPLLLAYDPGFQLSFIATLGLILLSPILEKKLMRIRSAFWRDLLAVTLAAQIAVLPLLLYQTGIFSLVSLPANLLVLPIVPLAMLLSFVAGIMGMALPAIAPVFGFPAHVFLSYIIETGRFLANLPLASLSVPQFPFLVTILAYIGLGWLVYKGCHLPESVPVPRKV